MTTEPIPAVPRRRQPGDSTRPSSEAAWVAAWHYLGLHGPTSRADLIVVMQDASPITDRTAREVLIAAVTENKLEVASRDHSGRPILRRPA
jgi:hypothetical protein